MRTEVGVEIHARGRARRCGVERAATAVRRVRCGVRREVMEGI